MGELLQAGDIGLIPWVPLTDFADPPETMLERCREAIERHAPVAEMANLLAVTEVLTFLRYNDVDLLTILGGSKVILESPLIQNLLAEKVHQDIVMFLEARFGDVPRDLVEDIESVVDEKQLKGLVRLAGSCSDLGAFRNAITRR